MKLTKEYLDKNNIEYIVATDGLITINDDLDLRNTNITVLENVEKVSGSVDVREGATFEAPALTEVSGYVDVREGATFEAPALTKSGYVYVYKGATFEAPALTEVGEFKYNGKFLGEYITVIDGIGCVILSEKQKDDVSIKFCKKSQFKDGNLVGGKFYVATKDNLNAHGETIKEAIEELLFKSGGRDVSQYKGMALDTVKTPDEWAFVYRMITGACKYGTREFIKTNSTKTKYSLSEILKVTNGAYGHKTFKDAVNE